MKLGIVTWITYLNYGTVLQAYAMQKAVERLGHSAQILSDRLVLEQFRKAHPYQTEKKQSHAVPPQSAAERMTALIRHPRELLRTLKARLDPDGFLMPYELSQKAISDFVEETLCVREGVVPEDLDLLNEDYDAFLCGSDQIWSVFPVNFNPYYFLDFAEKPKISYAPSLGTDRIPSEMAEKIGRLLRDFSAISVRESKSAEQLSVLLNREVSWVADPTLLHDRQFWESFSQPISKRKKPYLLCYFLENREWYHRYAEQLAKKLHLRLLLLPSRWEHLSRGCVYTEAIGPREFVARFRDAAYVLTDSYHGSIFSLLFEKDFQYLLRFGKDDPISQNLRIESLFNYLGLQDRIVAEEGAGQIALSIPDVPKVNQRIELLRAKSRDYLASALRLIPASTGTES